MVTLKLKEIPDICIDVEGILPEGMEGKRIEEIERMKIFYGNKKIDLGEFFDVYSEGDGLIFEGDLRRVKRIGSLMKRGEMTIRGDAGMYVGAFMESGKITVEGGVGPFSALNMRGGEIIIKGNAGDYLGASYRGEWRGMSSGKILVMGNAGKEVGSYMRGGIIVIKGFADSFCGTRMSGGTIFANKANLRAGAGMKAGSIILNEVHELLPGFFFEGKEKVNFEEGFEGEYMVFSGDHAERRAKGKIYVKKFTSTLPDRFLYPL
jgi:formylmethanofuran dehydrogenase subunit C